MRSIVYIRVRMWQLLFISVMSQRVKEERSSELTLLFISVMSQRVKEDEIFRIDTIVYISNVTTSKEDHNCQSHRMRMRSSELTLLFISVMSQRVKEDEIFRIDTIVYISNVTASQRGWDLQNWHYCLYQ